MHAKYFGNIKATPSLTRVGIDDIAVFVVIPLIMDPFIEPGERFVL